MGDSGMAVGLPKVPANADAASIARRLLRQRRYALDITERADALMRQDQILGKTMRRLALYLSPEIKTPYSHEPLYICCIREGIRRHAQFDHAELARRHFVLASFRKAAFVLRYDLVDEKGRWDPLHSEPLTYWLQGRVMVGSGQSHPEWPLLSIPDFIEGLIQRLIDDGEIEFKDEIQEYC